MRRFSLALAALLGLAVISVPSVAWTQTPGAETAQTAWSVIKSQHLRLPFPRNIQRIAVGDQDIASVEIVTSRELLVLGKETGRTTLIIWFADGGLTERVISVGRDLAILQAALRQVHPSLAVESAPDRDAIILTGRVPDFAVAQRAESVARTYLDAGSTRNTAARPLFAVQGQTPAQGPAAPPPGQAPPAGAAALTAPDPARLQGELTPTGTIINLIQLDQIPLLPEEKILQAIRPLGGQLVTIRRVLRGNLRDDGSDTLVLEGEVPNQIALVRILQVAAQLFAFETVDIDNVRVVADEGGGLSARTSATTGGGSGGSSVGIGASAGGGSGNGLGGGGGATGNRALGNDLQRNIGRATAVSVAGGRILSFIEVADLPQIRVNVRVFEINRERLKSRTPQTGLLASSRDLPSADTSPAAVAAQGQGTSRSGSSTSAVQNVLAFLSGGFLNEFQFTGNNFAVLQAMALLEREGIARTLSSPSLTVLSGESARFQVGGEVPVPVAFSPAVGGQTGSTPGIFSAVDFVSFGLQLSIRPLVGEDDTITLDVQPSLITPDAALTASIRDTTGTNQSTTAFSTRSLRTSSRLPDGQTLLIGGLTTQSSSLNTTKTPGLGDIPGLGRLFKSFNRGDDSLDLVIVVNPVILRPRVPDVALWAFPGTDEFLNGVARSSGAIQTSPSPASPR